MALQASREEKERLQKIKEMQLMIEPPSERDREEMEEELKKRAKE